MLLTSLTSLGHLHAATLDTSTLIIYHQLNNHIKTQWQALKRNPLSKQSYFVHDNLGSIHLLKDNTLNTEPLIDLKKYFPRIHFVNAVALHPSFNIQKNYGYLTLYSAHTEPADETKSTVRIHENNNQINQKFEIVISEWQFSDDKLPPVKTKTTQPREVLRLPISSADLGVMQLQFNPYVKPWNENYGELYFTLKSDPNKPDSALYSGSILRINPEKFGFKSYTIPEKNPFVNSDNIINEVIATGLKNLFEIHWEKDGSNKLLITHFSPKKFSASTINHGEDIRKSESKLTYITAPLPQQSNSIIYRGVKFAKFRNNVLYLAKDKHWKLIAIVNKPPYQVSTLVTFSDNELPQNKELVLLTDEHDELLILDKSQQVIFTINPPQILVKQNKEQAQESIEHDVPQQDSVMRYWVVLLLLLLTVIVIIFLRKKKLSLPKALLRKHFAKFLIHSNHKSLSIYKRHEDIASIELNVSDIVRSEILLNNALIYSFNSENLQDCFSDKKEQMVSLSFSNEKRGKMVDEKVRKIELLLTDKALNTYPICVYLRKGNQRLTKGKYEEVCQQLIDWCWLLSQVIFPDITENRIILKPIIPTTPKRKKADESNNNEIQTPKINTSKASAEKETPTEPKAASTIATEKQKNETEDTQQLREISLINALDKLGKLKQKGLLTEVEFSEAKAKVLQNLANSD
ncbi:MAG: hypothetical protein P8I03_09390 [Thalassotalea sp.]|nr:hypothetical protein [Thalassotalea sp.]